MNQPGVTSLEPQIELSESQVLETELSAELKAADLLMDGEISIAQNDNPDQPFVYRGFQMVNQEKLPDVAPEKIAEWHKNGILSLIHAHLFSLDLMRTIFGRQVEQGNGPKGAAGAAPAKGNGKAKAAKKS